MITPSSSSLPIRMARSCITLATWSGRHITFFPKHYLSQFHTDYNPNVDELVAQEEGVEDWVGLLNKKAAGPTDDTQNFFLYPERPTLFPWIVQEPLGSGTTITHGTQSVLLESRSRRQPTALHRYRHWLQLPGF